MPSLSSRILFWITISLLALAILVVSAVSYTAVAQPGCESCHLTGTFGADTSRSPHTSVQCTDCHVQPSAAGRVSFATRQVFHMVIPVVPVLDRSYSFVSNDRCLSCHKETADPGHLGSKGLRIEHSKCAVGRQCTDCHSTTAHGASTRWPSTAQMEDCYECHGRTNKKVACDTCHTERPERQRVSTGAFRVTHGKEWKTTHGMGDMRSCVACHDDKKCGKCHGPGVPHEGNFLSTHAEFSVLSQAKCTSCHLKKFCADCHAYPMPHSEKFVLGHSRTVKTDGERRCLTCHVKDDCVQCHEDHVHPVTSEQMNGFMLKPGRPSGGNQ